jgi:hypothetical protein
MFPTSIIGSKGPHNYDELRQHSKTNDNGSSERTQQPDMKQVIQGITRYVEETSAPTSSNAGWIGPKRLADTLQVSLPLPLQPRAT